MDMVLLFSWPSDEHQELIVAAATDGRRFFCSGISPNVSGCRTRRAGAAFAVFGQTA